ncbi:hypothetical protein ACUSIJ_06415 [Pseudochelatococcus sp. B33]
MQQDLQQEERGMESAARGRWRAFAVTLVATVMVLFPALTLGLYLLDPYGSGRVRLIDPPGVRAQGTRTEHASRARDPAFDSIIIGNSRMQALNPERLTALTGARFASLTVPGTRPKEQLTLLDWFLRHRETPPAALVIGTDIFWCHGGESAFATVNPFPFWLYENDTLAYLRGLARFTVLQEGFRRIEYVAGGRERARPDGYWDYDPIYESHGFEGEERRALLMEYKPEDVVNETGVFPALDALGAMLGALPQETVVALMEPPAFVTGQPRPDTPEGRTDEACHQALSALAEARPRTFVIDWRGERPETGNPDDYFDQIHYKGKLARLLEDQLAARIRSLLTE